MKFPFKKVIFDGGAIIELLLSGNDSDLLKNIIDEKLIPLATNLALIETEYILCRKIGKDKAFEKVDNLLNSNYFKIVSLENLYRSISIIKCFNPIALPDCATIALALKNKVPALYFSVKSLLKIRLFKILYSLIIHYCIKTKLF